MRYTAWNRGLIILLPMQTSSATRKGVVELRDRDNKLNHSVRLQVRQRAFSHVFTHCQVSKLIKGAYTSLFIAGILVVASLNLPINSDGPFSRTMIGVSGFSVSHYEYLRHYRTDCAPKRVASHVPCPVGISHVQRCSHRSP